MRRVIYGLVAVVMMVGLVVGCAAPTPAPAPAPAPTPAPAPAPAPTPATVVWRLACTNPANTFMGEAALYLVDKVEELTNGRLIIQPYFAGALGYKSPDMLGVVQKGIVDMANWVPPATAGAEPLGGPYSLPGFGKGYEEYWEIQDNVSDPFFAKLLSEKWGIIPLGSYTVQTNWIALDKEVNSPADLKGLKLRTMGGGDLLFLEASGAEPVYLPMEDVYTGVQRGIVKGMCNTPFSHRYMAIYEVCDYLNSFGWLMGGGMYIMNKNSFEALPKDLQDAVMEAGGLWSKRVRQAAKDAEEADLKVCTDNGMILRDIPPAGLEEFRALTIPIWKKWAEDNGPPAWEYLKTLSEFRPDLLPASELK